MEYAKSFSGECHLAILEFDSSVKVPAAFSLGPRSPLPKDWVADSGASHHFGRDRIMFKNLRRIDGNLNIRQLIGISEPVSLIGTVVLVVDGDEGKQTLELHNVILKESLRHNIFSLQLARKQGLEYEISNVQGAKNRLVNRLQDGSIKLSALMTEEAGRWTLDTSFPLQTPMTTSVLAKSGIDTTKTVLPNNRVSTFGQISVGASF